MTNLDVTWSEYHHKIETLAVKIQKSNWQFDHIVCLAKGGLRVGDILCRIFDCPLAILAVSSYGGINKKQRGQIKFASHLTTVNPLGNQILLVDDLVDSGISLQESIQWLKNHHQLTRYQIRTAVLWYKSSSVITPDYFIDYLLDNPWINQPFEKYDQLNIAELSSYFENS